MELCFLKQINRIFTIMKLLDFPIVRVTLFFIVGIFCCYYTNPNPIVVFVFLAISTLVFLSFYFRKSNSLIPNFYFGLSLYSLFFFLGVSISILHQDNIHNNHYSHFDSFYNQENQIELVIKEKIKNSKNYNRYFAEIQQINNHLIRGKILLQIKKNKTTENLPSGTQLQISEQLVSNFKPNNPNQFDYGKYLESKSVYAQIFSDVSQLKISKNYDKSLWYYTSKFRNRIIENLQKSGFKKEELAVVVALVLGQQQDISADVIQDYQYAGAVHILSVSGLHVGFIMLFITFLLKPLPNTQFGNTIRFVIVIVCLWLFALVAGLAPSVVRSATMFSFLALGLFLNRMTNSFHTMVVSLFLILLIEPMFLFDIGFQLSYVALFFILWLQPILKSFWTPNSVIITYFWDIITVSFAAQIGAMPLSIYYFHQFPGLFFITNLVLIPCLSVIMALGLFLMILAYFDLIPIFLSKIVESCISLMNGFIKWIASFESLVIKEIPLSIWLLCSLYVLIFSWIFWLKKPNYPKFSIALGSVLIFQLCFVITQWNKQSEQEWIVFNAKKQSIIGLRNGKTMKLFTADSLSKNSFEKNMVNSFATANFCTVKSVETIKNLHFFNDNKILIIDQSNIFDTKIKPDIIVIRNSPKLNLERLFSIYKPKIIIADASNFKTYVTLWKNSCINAKIPFHSVYEKGFYRLKSD